MNQENKHGFKAPKGYFENFEENFTSKFLEEELPSKSGFKVPENYFEKFENSIFQKLEKENTTKVISIFSKKTYLYAASIAACAILIFSVLNFNTTVSLDDIEVSDIEEYFTDYETNLNTADLAQLLTDEEINTISLDLDLFTDENLENYILENVENTSLLIE